MFHLQANVIQISARPQAEINKKKTTTIIMNKVF